MNRSGYEIPNKRTAEDWIGALGMAALCVITMLNVAVRYASDESFAWTEEFSVFLLVLTTMAGASAATLRDNHIRIEFFLESGSLRRRRMLALGGILVTALFFMALAFLTGRMAWDDLRYGEISMGLGVPRWWYKDRKFLRPRAANLSRCGVFQVAELCCLVRIVRVCGCKAGAQAVLWQILRPFGAFWQIRKQRGLRSPLGAVLRRCR